MYLSYILFVFVTVDFLNDIISRVKKDYVDEKTQDTVLMQQYFIAFLKKGPNRSQSQKEADIINDIVTHTLSAVLKANILGGYESISEKDSFEMEYWELEQAKLKK